MKYPTQEELLELSRSERLRLIEDVWETFVSEPQSLPLNEDHRQELDRRIEAWERDPEGGQAWPVVRKRITDRG